MRRGRPTSVSSEPASPGSPRRRQLQQAGRSVVVLEARDRVGRPDLDPAPVRRDPGGPRRCVARRPTTTPPSPWSATSASRPTRPGWPDTTCSSATGATRRYRGLIPKISPLAVLTIAAAQFRIDRTAKRVPVDAPWDARRAEEWDARTVGSWLEHSGIRTTIGRDLFEMAVRGLFAAELEEVSLLHLLLLVHAHRNTHHPVLDRGRRAGEPRRRRAGLGRREGGRGAR